MLLIQKHRFQLSKIATIVFMDKCVVFVRKSLHSNMQLSWWLIDTVMVIIKWQFGGKLYRHTCTQVKMVFKNTRIGGHMHS